MADIVLRPAQASEIALISDSWVKSLGPKPRVGPLGDSYMSIGQPRADVKISPNLWWTAHRMVVGGILDGAAVIVAVHPEHPDAVLGWIAFEAGIGEGEEPTMTLHYCWVRKEARKRGIGQKLLLAALHTVPEDVEPRIRLTHSTPDGERLLQTCRIA